MTLVPRVPDGPIPYVNQIVATLAQANVAIPAVVATVLIVRQLWQATHPDDAVTDEQLIATMGDTYRQLGAQAEAEIAACLAQLTEPDTSG